MIASSTIINWRTPTRAAEYAASIASCWRKGMAHWPEAYQEGASEEQAGASLTQIMDALRGGAPSPRPGRRAYGQRLTRDQVSTASLPLTSPETQTNAGLHLRVRPERIRAGPGLDRGLATARRRGSVRGMTRPGRSPGNSLKFVLVRHCARPQASTRQASPYPARQMRMATRIAE